MTTKVQSILSYIGILWLAAYFGGKNDRNDLSRYHLKQGLGLFTSAIVFNLFMGIVLFIIPSLGVITAAFSIVFLVLMVLGIITASNQVKRPLPLIGKFFENKFSFIDK